MKPASNWFDLPSLDFDRARTFYETVLGVSFPVQPPAREGEVRMAFFPDASPGGAIVHDPRLRPGVDGPVVYLNVNGALDACVARVEAAGGKVLVPVTGIGEHGRIALLIDSEGNRVGLHDATRA